MRDGERFFAQGRDNANYELRQQQMKRASDWRLNLRTQILRELSGLGRTAPPSPPAHYPGVQFRQNAADRKMYLGAAEYDVSDFVLPQTAAAPESGPANSGFSLTGGTLALGVAVHSDTGISAFGGANRFAGETLSV